MIDEIKDDAQTRMRKSIDALHQELQKIRTGRAHTSLLDHIKVAYYGSDVPINQVASVTVSDARTLTVTPWEKKSVTDVEKAIMNSGLGLNPVTTGDVIRIPLPPLTEERRKDLVRVVKQEAENARIAIRNIRRDANGQLKMLLKEKEISEDEDRGGESDVQSITDKFIAEVEDVLKQKEADLLEV
ncbi:MAG: ribosome recycling factor [Pseudomonadota bacterium]